MPRYKFKGYDKDGTEVLDILTAPSRTAAIDELERIGILVTSLRAVILQKTMSRCVSGREFHGFNQEMIALTRAGIPIVECLDMCIPQPNNNPFTEVLRKVRQKVIDGQAYSDACEQYPEVFDLVYVSTVRTSEQTGELLTSLKQYQHYIERRIKLIGEIQQSLYYPAFLLFTLLVVVVILFTFVVPSFTELYESLDAELPKATQIVLFFADITPAILAVIAVFSAIGISAWKSVSKPPSFLIFVDRKLNQLPFMGKLRLMLQQTRVLRMLSGMLSAGTPLVTALKTSARLLPGLEMGEKMRWVASEVESGKKLSDSLNERGVLRGQHIKMINIGEDSGALGEMIDEVTVYLEERLDAYLKRVSSLFEPAVMLLLGVLVGAIIISMYLPIFFLAEVVQ